MSLCLPAVRGKSAPRQMRLTTPPASPMAMAASHHYKGDGGTPFGQSLIVRALTRDYLRGHTTPQLNASSLPYPRTAAQVRHCQLSGAHTPPQLNASLLPYPCTAAQARLVSCQGRHVRPSFKALSIRKRPVGRNKPLLPLACRLNPVKKYKQAGDSPPRAAWVSHHAPHHWCEECFSQSPVSSLTAFGLDLAVDLSQCVLLRCPPAKPGVQCITKTWQPQCQSESPLRLAVLAKCR